MCVQLVCTDAEHVRPWMIEVGDGRIQRVARGFGVPNRRPSSRTASRSVGDSSGCRYEASTGSTSWSSSSWSTVVGPTPDSTARRRLDRPDNRHPPLGAYLTRACVDRLADRHAVHQSPPRRRAARISAASTRPVPTEEGVGSDIAWRDNVLVTRRPHDHVDAVSRRAWRGHDDDIMTIRTALLCGRQLPDRPPLVRARRIALWSTVFTCFARCEGCFAAIRHGVSCGDPAPNPCVPDELSTARTAPLQPPVCVSWWAPGRDISAGSPFTRRPCPCSAGRP